MDPKEFNQLLHLAKNIGGQAWKLLVEQQIVIGVEECIGAAILILSAVTASVVAVKIWRALQRKKKSDHYYDSDNYIIPMVISIIAAGVCLGFGIPTGTDGVAHLLFPQVFALQTLLPGGN